MIKIQDIRNRTPKRSSKRSLESVTHIARHHSATTAGNFDSFWNNRWKGLGWITGGYHEIIFRDGTVQLCYDADMVTNGVGNHNSYTYHICIVGNGSFTPAQEKAWEERCLLAMQRLNIPVNRVLGHNEFKGTATSCPGIDMSKVRTRLIEVQKEVSKLAQEVSKWAEDSHKWVKEQGVSDGERPKDNVTREEVWTMLFSFYNKVVSK